MRMNRYISWIQRWLLLALLPFCTSLAMAQEQGEKAPEKWYHKVGKWVQGEPWSWQGALPMTHTKYLVQWEGMGVLDEYLSPIAHNGMAGRVTFLTDFASPKEQCWHIYQDLSLYLAQLKNKSNGTSMYSLGIDYAVGPSWRVLQHKGLSLDLAPLLALEVGGHLKNSNTNNLGSVKAHLGLDGWGRVRYQIPWHVLPLSISYSAQIPLVMGFFHPEYGQSYYDFVSGDNGAKIAIHFGSFHNTIGIKQRLLIDLPIHNLTLTLGAEHRHFAQTVNHTTYKSGSWGFVIGISVDSFKLSGGRAVASSNLLSRYRE